MKTPFGMCPTARFKNSGHHQIMILVLTLCHQSLRSSSAVPVCFGLHARCYLTTMRRKKHRLVTSFYSFTSVSFLSVESFVFWVTFCRNAVSPSSPRVCDRLKTSTSPQLRIFSERPTIGFPRRHLIKWLMVVQVYAIARIAINLGFNIFTLLN